MKAEVTKLSSNQVKIDFEVEPELFEKGMSAAYRKNVKRINIPGFRRGKAPRKVIELHYGESLFYEDAIEEIFPGVYDEAIKANDLSPVDRPDFELGNIGGGEPLTFSVTVYVRPDVTLGQYKGLEVHKHHTYVTEDDVKADIERARDRAATFTDITDRPVKLDDQITLNFKGFIDEVPFEGGEAEGHELTVGSGSFIPGFEEQLVGLEIDQEAKIPVTFPEDYHAEEMKGKPAVFEVKVTAIREKEMPELDDEFAKDVSEFETLEEYRDSVRETLQKAADERDEQDFENQVIEAAAENAQVDIPECMIEDRVEEQMRDMRMRLMFQGMDIERYLEYTGQTEEQMREMMYPGAEHDVKIRLVLSEIQKAENIEPTDEEIDAEIAKYAERARRDLAEYKEKMDEDDRERFNGIAKAAKVIDLLKNEAVEPKETGEEAEEEEETDE